MGIDVRVCLNGIVSVREDQETVLHSAPTVNLSGRLHISGTLLRRCCLLRIKRAF